MTISLPDFFSKYEVLKYFLIADIEGTEKHFILEDTAGLKQCSGMIIEVYPLDYKWIMFSVEQLKKIIIGLRFTINSEDAAVFLATKD